MANAGLDEESLKAAIAKAREAAAITNLGLPLGWLQLRRWQVLIHPKKLWLASAIT